MCGVLALLSRWPGRPHTPSSDARTRSDRKIGANKGRYAGRNGLAADPRRRLLYSALLSSLATAIISDSERYAPARDDLAARPLSTLSKWWHKGLCTQRLEAVWALSRRGSFARGG